MFTVNFLYRLYSRVLLYLLLVSNVLTLILVNGKRPGPLSFLFEKDTQATNASSFLIERLHTNEKIQHMCTARVITPSCEILGELLIGESCLYFVPDTSQNEGEEKKKKRGREEKNEREKGKHSKSEREVGYSTFPVF